jgi:hypothetical protein
MIEEFPPAPPPLFIQPTPVANHNSAGQPQLQQHLLTDGLLHADRYSDAGTEATIEQRPDEIPTDEMLAGMHALNNPQWWTHAMMPGFSWPQQESPLYSTAPIAQQHFDVNSNVIPYASSQQAQRVQLNQYVLGRP